MANQPSMLDADSYRQVMGRFATGVAVLLTQTDEGEPIGMTANALTSVSLKPMLLLVCVGKNANIAANVLNGEIFTLCFLNEEQAAVSDYFAGIYSKPTPPEFRIEPWGAGLRLVNCIGAILCARTHIYEEGDHWIVMGEVKAMDIPEIPDSPLIFYTGRYHRLAPGAQEHQ